MNIRQSYREAAVQGASPVELAIRLYEQMIEDLRQVSNAIEKGDIRLRTNRIRHALLVLGYLQSALDFERGGKVAKDLDHFYDVLRGNLVQLQFHPSRRGAAQLITDLVLIREAWIEVDVTQKSAEKAAAGAKPSAVRPYSGDDSDHVPMNWQG